VEEQLRKYLQSEVKLLVTACLINECENLGPKLTAATQLLKSFAVHRCGHEKTPIAGSACIKEKVKTNHYIIATQDRDLQDWIRRKPGIPLLYLHQVAPTLEQPSEASRKFADKQTAKTVEVTKLDGDRLKLMKRKEGLAVEATVVAPKKKKKVGGPNPLSCKKKKKTSGKTLHTTTNKAIEKKKRVRVKVAKHVKEVLRQQGGDE
jgi:U3 small nucleolar RNA-associated protein 23